METTEGCHYMSNLSKLSTKISTRYITGRTMEEGLNHILSHVLEKED